MTITKELSVLLSAAFEACGYAAEYGTVTSSNRPDLCQFQCNGAMAAAKRYKKAPIAIATEVVARIAEDNRLSDVQAVPPGFINLNLSDEYLRGVMNDMGRDKRHLLPTMEPKTIVIDYGGPNLAKPLHVGHLRTAIIGDTLYKLAKFLGHNTIGDVHFGDWGLQMGLVICEIRRMQPELCYFDPDFTGEYPAEAPVSVDDLNDIYPAASARAKEDEAFAAEAAQATVELQGGRRGYRALWKRLRELSVSDLQKSYDILGVSFDYWYGESDAERFVPRVMELLREKNLLRESDGALVVDVAREEDTEPMPPIIIEKSNGGEVYGTTDVATLLQRKEEWKPDEVWYVVDTRQSLHFKQVFRCAALAGILGDTECHHINYGTMNGKDGKPYKTRAGGVMRLSDLIETVTESAYRRTSQSEVAMDEEQARAVAQIVGVAALKIGDMVNHRTKDYIFDMDRFLASEGKTGPYLQYTAVRIGSVLRKAGKAGLTGENGDAGIAAGKILAPASGTERELMLALTSVGDALLRAFREKAPSVICEVMFDIAGVFNRFYFENKILSCPDEARRASWLGLLELTLGMLNTLLGLLGIQVPEQM